MLRQWLVRLAAVKNLSRRDVTAFITSLLLAFIFWLTYSIDQNYDGETLKVPVVAESDIQGHQRLSSNVCLIEASCYCSGRRILALSRAERKDPVVVHFDSAVFTHKSGDEFFVSANDLGGYISEIFGKNVTLRGFSTTGFTFNFPVENHKTVAVVPVSVISYKSQYMSRSGLSVTPDSVIVYGEPQYLENIDKIVTEPLQMNNLSSSKSGSLKLDVPKGIRLSQSAVNYSLDVTRYVEITKSVPVAVRNAPAGKTFSVYPSVADVAFKCVFPMPSDRTDEVVIYIDYADFAKSRNGRCIAKVSELPSGVIDCEVTPDIFDCIENGG